ncbi:MAG: glucodextranase DOMON-like domain-containing protein [Acidilobaceae archaeon]
MRALFLLALLSTLALAPLAEARTVIDITDPEGDDRGPGYYGYPGNAVFKPGVFDLVRFQVVDEGASLAFRLTFKDLGGNPWGGPNGFCLQHVHVYVRTTQAGLARMDSLGLNIAFPSSHAWHFAIIVAPGWEEKVVPAGQRAGIYFYSEAMTQDGDMTVSVEGNSIIVRVRKTKLIDTENVDKWTITVALASYDGFGPARVRPAGPTGGEWVLNGTRFATPEQRGRIAKAIAEGMEPRVMDLAMYSPTVKGIDAATQFRWLDSFDVDTKRLAQVPFAPVERTITVEKTLEKQVTLTETKTETNWPISIGLLIVGLAVGFLVARFLLK